MSWRPLATFRDPAVPKLHNLRRADAVGLRVPPTRWVSAAVATVPPPDDLGPPPWIVRSGSPTEDTRTTSNAGQLLSLVVADGGGFAEAYRRVRDALPSGGAIFVQPLVRADEAGVAFCDGFYFERTVSGGTNEALTAGQARGAVTRGHFERDDPWSDWLAKVYAVFARDRRIDIEFARDADGYVLLQARPALFPVKRNPTVSLTNHKEILGDPPSPWIVSVLVAAGKDLSFLAKADRRIRDWDETYAIEAAGRGWVNVSFWLRWMDHFGLPRTLFTEGFGGSTPTPGDRRIAWRQFLPAVPKLVRFQLACLAVLPNLKREFRRYDAVIAKATTLPELHAATTRGLALALYANFAINAALSGWLRIRKLLRIPGSARIVTQRMMEDYRRLGALAPEHRAAGLDAWLKQYGHRGPLESDPMRPRFAELRDVLWKDLSSVGSVENRPGPVENRPHRIGRFVFALDEKREWFRDQLMRRWQTLRTKTLAEAARLAEAGELDDATDVFWLHGDDLTGRRPLREAVAANEEKHRTWSAVEVPMTASLEEVNRVAAEVGAKRAAEEGRRLFAGIGLTPVVVEGVVRRADDLMALLSAGGFGPETILVVPTLEPSWAVVFPRVGGVVAEVGGELSHASILLREARKPAVVNCAGVYRAVRDGQRVRLDGTRGTVEIV